MYLNMKLEFKILLWLCLENVFCYEIWKSAKEVSFEKVPGEFRRVEWRNLSLNHVADYIYDMKTLLNKSASDKHSVNPEDLNKFNLALHHFYWSLAHEVYYNQKDYRFKHFTDKNYLDPMPLPNATAFGEPVIYFYNMETLGHDLLKECKRDNYDHDIETYMEYYEIERHYTADALLFRGRFSVFHEDCGFNYNFKKCTLDIKHHKRRCNDGSIHLIKKMENLKFENEEMHHMYGRTLKKYDMVEKKLTNAFGEVLKRTYLPHLMSIIQRYWYGTDIGFDIEYARKYREKVREYLIKSAQTYMSMLNATSFHLPSTNFTKEGSNKTLSNLKIEGLLNFIKYKFNASETKRSGDTLLMYDTINFLYTNQTQCLLSCTIIDGKKTSKKKYLVESILISTVYSAKIDKLPTPVERKRDAFPNGTGFSVVIKLSSAISPAFEVIVQRIADEMARVVEETVDSHNDFYTIYG